MVGGRKEATLRLKDLTQMFALGWILPRQIQYHDTDPWDIRLIHILIIECK